MQKSRCNALPYLPNPISSPYVLMMYARDLDTMKAFFQDGVRHDAC